MWWLGQNIRRQERAHIFAFNIGADVKTTIQLDSFGHTTQRNRPRRAVRADMELAERDAVNLIRVLERCAALADGIETLPAGQLARLTRLQR